MSVSLPPPPHGATPPVATPPRPVRLEEPAPRRSRHTGWLIALGVSLLAVVVLGVAIAIGGSDGGDGLPASVLGVPRYEDAETRAIQDAAAQVDVGDVEIAIGTYGQDSLEVLLYDYVHPGPFSIEGMVRGAVGGFVAYGGEADLDALTTRTVEGNDYVCVPLSIPMSATDPAPTDAVACGWAQSAERSLLVVDSLTTDVDEAASHADSIRRSLDV
jgi:hypothetical protein